MFQREERAGAKEARGIEKLHSYTSHGTDWALWARGAQEPVSGIPGHQLCADSYHSMGYFH